MNGIHHEDTQRTIERVARESYGRLVAFLSAHTHDLAGAEDALSNALVAALTRPFTNSASTPANSRRPGVCGNGPASVPVTRRETSWAEEEKRPGAREAAWEPVPRKLLTDSSATTGRIISKMAAAMAKAG